jgi:hypothetical protein
MDCGYLTQNEFDMLMERAGKCSSQIYQLSGYLKRDAKQRKGYFGGSV